MKPFLLLISILLANSLFSSSIKEHVYGGLPSQDDLVERTAYVLDYDSENKAPRWVAYHLVPDYRNTPKRTGKWASYRNDPDRDNEPSEVDYKGMHADEIRNYARGHLAPFMISGGDRDGDGFYLDHDKDGKVETEENDDPDEAITVKEINYHTNLTPQHHNAFNGAGGIWFAIEDRVRELLEEIEEIWVFAGPIFGRSDYDEIGEGVKVAPMFFQILITETEESVPDIEAYMMPHHQKAHGEIEDYLVSIRHIEAMTGLDFFPELEIDERTSTFKKNDNR